MLFGRESMAQEDDNILWQMLIQVIDLVVFRNLHNFAAITKQPCKKLSN